MHEKLQEFLKKLGVKPETISLFTDEDKKEELAKLSSDELVSAVTETYKNRFENDQNFLDPIEKRIRGKVLGSKERNILKQVPEITKEEVEALPQETRYDSLVELAIDKIAERNKGKGQGDNEALRTAKQEAKKLQEQVEKYEKEVIPGLKESHQSQLDDIHLLDATKKHLSSKKEGVLGNPEFLAKAILADAKENFVVKLEDGKPSLYQKPKEGSDELLEAYEGNDRLTYTARVDKFLEENQLVRKSNAEPGGGKPGGGGNPDPAPSSNYNLPGMARAEANIEKMGS